MAGQHEILQCPFCKEGHINALFFPSAMSVKVKSTATFGKSIKRTMSAQVWIIKSGCAKCGKTASEVEKELKDEGII